MHPNGPILTGVTTNGTTVTQGFNTLDQQTSTTSGSAPTYDADGNTLTSGSGQTSVYDAWNRLVSVQYAGTTAASAVYSSSDTTTQGTWSSSYGGQGSDVIDGSESLPSYASVTNLDGANYVWDGSPTDTRALQVSSGSTSRVAACWYSSSPEPSVTPSFLSC